MRAIRKHLPDFAAIVALCSIGLAVAYVILQNQRLRIPVLEEKPYVVNAEFSTAQAVVPGQGQTVRVAGVRIGDIGGTELKDGRAIIRMEIDQEFKDLLHRDAKALLRPKTGLKDMFIDLDPGTPSAPLAGEGWTMPIASTLPDVNPDEFLSALDADTRDHLKLLLDGAGRGLDGRADDLRAVLKRFEPTYRDIALVTGEVKKRRVELRRLINSLNKLNARLASKDDDLAQLVSESSKVFRQFAAERQNVAGIARELPGALESTRDALGQVGRMARVLKPAALDLIPVARALDRANRATLPFAREAAPILRDEIRPFVRVARPTVRALTPAARDLVKAEPYLTRSFKVLNNLFNMLGHNPGGRQGPGVDGRDEGFLFYLAWLGHQSTNMFANQDAHGPMRSLTLGGTCATINGVVQSQPQIEQLLGLSGVLTDPDICGLTALPAKQRVRTYPGGNR